MASSSRVLKSRELPQALRLAQAGRRREAIVLLRELSQQHPTDALVWFHLGAMLDASGKMREAIPCYLRALRLNPRHPQHYEMCLYLCSSYRKTDRPVAARRWLNQAKTFHRDTSLQRRLERLLNSGRS
ncbi:MAG TPA: tetratricopeptide repeat protein [Pirellulales bacterium]|jgi:Flp pilus assembly protein TadD|nr:tetratricopeptide repeat protein [Pirellulales bacterium]